MDVKHTEYVGILKALADNNRLRIVDMLCGGELCACRILVKFKITQPTLSHHMKILCDCGLVKWRKEGKWTYYSLNDEVVKRFCTFISSVTTVKDPAVGKDTCLCLENVEGSCC